MHSGDLNAGHYYAYIQPEMGGKWYKFDDDKVLPVTTKEVLEDNFGGDMLSRPGSKSIKNFSNAYMLVYIREADREEILPEIGEKDIPQHLGNMCKVCRQNILVRRFEEEKMRLEAKRKEREESHLYVNVKVKWKRLLFIL